MADYIPEPDAEFNTWQQNFVSYATNNTADLGLTADQITELGTLSFTWSGDYGDHITAQDAAHAATETKNLSRSNLVAYIRQLASFIQANPDVSDASREGAGLPVHKTSRTAAPTPTTRPVVEVDAMQRLRHIIHFRDEGAEKKAKPKGVAGCEIWVKVGTEPPTSTGDVRFLGVDTRTPYLAEFEMSDGGQNAYYMLRWVNTRGEQGPWSETVQATIQG